MKLPFTDTFGYIHNWQIWVNKEDNWLCTLCGLFILANMILISTLFLINAIWSRILHFQNYSEYLFTIHTIIVILFTLYIYSAFIFHKRYRKFIDNPKYIGRKARIKVILAFCLIVAYTYIGCLSPCYIK